VKRYRQIRVLAHYYVDPAHNPFCLFKRKLAAEVFSVPERGETIVISPEWMGMNETFLGPGVYKVVEVLPNNEKPEKIYDYPYYESWFTLDVMKMVVVKPIHTMSPVEFNNHEIKLTSSIDEDGICKESVIMTNVKTGEIKEIDIE